MTLEAEHLARQVGLGRFLNVESCLPPLLRLMLLLLRPALRLSYRSRRRVTVVAVAVVVVIADAADVAAVAAVAAADE
jgi:hypothetical protein